MSASKPAEPAAAAPADELFRRWAEQCGLGMLLTDREGIITFVNRRQLEASGYAEEEVIGRPSSLFGSGETPPEVYAVMWECIRGGRPWNGELINRRKGGEFVREYVRIGPIRDAQGDITHFYAFKDEHFFGRSQAAFGGSVATVDPLTALPNRAMLIDRLTAAIREADGKGESLAVMLLDIDRYRMLNETLGHAVADEILVRVAQRLRHGVRETDMAARVGSDQFALLLCGSSDAPTLEPTARRLLDAALAPMDVAGREVKLAGSVGIACFPLDARQADVLLQCAGAAMAVVKAEGGGGLRFYEPPAVRLAKEWSDLGEALRHVDQRDELALRYQPKVDLRSGRIVGVEALVRWQHPHYGLLTPNRFIPVAEETGLIVSLSQWVLRTVLRQLRAWQDAGRVAVPVGLNLSLRHFRAGDLPGMIGRELQASGVDPSLLELEISESAMMRDPTEALMTIDRIKSLGVRLALDDFGTGLSSLSYLSRMNVDKIKIDRSFVRDITSNPANASIVAAIVAMAHKLGKRVIAVGVESEGQALQLRRYDCDEIQGFYFSRPETAEEIGAQLAGGRNMRLRDAPTDARRLLLVDDEANILSALRRTLRREGYEILTAGSGAEALELLSTQPVQVIVSDQRMPAMSGIELLSRVRELYPDTCRIVLTGYSDIGTLTDAINRGAVWKYIAKPWDDEALRAEIRQAFALAA